MLLGTILAQLSDETIALETVTGLGDLTLLAHLQNAADDQNQTLGAVITAAVNHFTANADSDQWVQLMSKVNQSDNPGGAALKQMLQMSLPG